MDNFSKLKSGISGFCVAASLFASVEAAEAGSKKQKTVRTPAVFDISTRKKTKQQWGQSVTGAAYASLKLSHRGNLVRDDAVNDDTMRSQAYFGLAARAELGRGIIAFAHAELSSKHTETTAKSYGTLHDLTIKEALISIPLSQGVRVTAGRMRFQDSEKWVADSSVDGVHLGMRWGTKTALRGLDLALVQDLDTNASQYALVHAWHMAPTSKTGVFAIAEQESNANRLHFSSYHQRKVNSRLSYRINAGVVFGDLIDDRKAGFGFDLRATRKLEGKLKPQLTFGIAAGSQSFEQSGLHSNKTYDGGQTQVHRSGEVFRPELGNLAVATLSYGLRPSKKFSLNVTAHAFARISTKGPSPIARFDGALNSAGHFLGAEINVSGAWRPTKKSKVEFGAGRFNPGSAYTDRSSSTRLYARYTINF